MECNSSCAQYTFDDIHDPSQPAQVWFQHSKDGETLFVVFYSQACRWHQCLGCNLPSKMSSHHIGSRSLMGQIDHLLQDPQVIKHRKRIRKVIVSNNGSIMDKVTFSSSALRYLILQLADHLANLSVVSIETRPEYVRKSELNFLHHCVKDSGKNFQIEIAIGFEAFDDRVRNSVFHKGLKLETFERFVSRLSEYKYRLKCYFMQKPVPGMSDEEAVKDIQNAMLYLDSMAIRYGIEINMHLNPTYVAKGTMLEDAFITKAYAPPKLQDVARAVVYGKGRMTHLTVFIGLSDEGLAVDGGSFIRPGEEGILASMSKFNETQDYSFLASVV
jgi:radical SAM enzyme (TIGR01210 family)